jgi:hypothetical protein
MASATAPRREQNLRKQEAKAANSPPLCDVPFYLRRFQWEYKLALVAGWMTAQGRQGHS